MKTFSCASCNQLVFFENTQCVNCGAKLGFLPDRNEMASIEQVAEVFFTALLPDGTSHTYRMCQNYRELDICNWMVPGDDENPYCVSCRLNKIIPNLNEPDNMARWSRVEAAKRRLVFSLLDLKLPVISKDVDQQNGLSFELLGDSANGTDGEKVKTGHENGVITLNIAEADDLHREQARLQMNENYRTLLGHFRHEIGHYYWMLLVGSSSWEEPFRELFGDERNDYGESLERYYSSGPPERWHENYVSAYASAHPWEDWAETWAHYLHMIDTLQTAENFGLALQEFPHQQYELPEGIDLSQPADQEFVARITSWLPLTIALNSINRSMGHKDMYPFILSREVIAKLRFVHRVICHGNE